MMNTLHRLRQAVDKKSDTLKFLYGILTEEQFRLLKEWEESE
jgi:hypothetical protein